MMRLRVARDHPSDAAGSILDGGEELVYLLHVVPAQVRSALGRHVARPEEADAMLLQPRQHECLQCPRVPSEHALDFRRDGGQLLCWCLLHAGLEVGQAGRLLLHEAADTLLEEAV